eukprot:CAMPEP_0197056722 /NCGR_PEP_ID=MMETSP1384-20130603/88820_1 /TAXON_ID=29189 /ORGANISM="Ammonia sp." /LENGTH=86 /DNA_ID=CAMNT_0042490843 /DNA_START=169 /DNA_END=429 /DNA_ORIENTATION=-
MSFVIADELLCGKDNYTENIAGSKCVFIALDACVGLFLFFGFFGFIVSWIKGPIVDHEYAQLMKENDGSNESNENETEDNERHTAI